jgi:hypothetical protein
MLNQNFHKQKKGLFILLKDLKEICNNSNRRNYNTLRKSIIPRTHLQLPPKLTGIKIKQENEKICRNYCGGLKAPIYATIPNIAGDYQKLITPEMFAILVGVLTSDGYMSPSGAIVLTQTARQYSNYKVFLHLLQTLAPIISSVEIYVGPTQKIEVLTPNEYLSRMEKNVQNIEQLKQQEITPLHRHDTPQGRSGLAKPFAIRFTTYSLFKSWYNEWYTTLTSNSNQNINDVNSRSNNKTVKKIKKWPSNILEIYTSPITLATHLMLDGSKNSAYRRLKNTNTILSKSNNSTINLGTLCPETFAKILRRNFGLIGWYRQEPNKNNVIFSIQSDITYKGRAARNQMLFYRLVSPFLIAEMQRKIYNVFSSDRILSLGNYTEDQKMYLPSVKAYKKPSSYPYANYIFYKYFDFDIFLCYEGAHRLELTNGDLYMSKEIEEQFVEFFSIEWTCKKNLTPFSVNFINNNFINKNL